MPQHMPRLMPQKCCSIPTIDQTPLPFAPFFGGFVPEMLAMDGEARNALRERIQNSLTAVVMDDEISILPVCGTVGDDGGGRLKKPPAMARLLEIQAAVGAIRRGRCSVRGGVGNGEVRSVNARYWASRPVPYRSGENGS
ncbi:hypothetical protein FG93_04816 [Bosea sp. LC85]|uniref:hypothetical protein n=1 Tax=Bosea sp. LC85 TaxID=1502851 RepID=UPI0004E3338F|nr:hypothetical protein [Bosea sp. LC85]KFC65275.1 hypothetical protein FG93_04816 [Bosea sp. LC85]